MSGMDRLTGEQMAAYAHVDSVIKDAQSFGGGYLWHGWSIREAFLAGAAWEAHRRASQAAPAPSDGLREALERLSTHEAFTHQGWGFSHPEITARVDYARAALSPSPSEEGGK